MLNLQISEAYAFYAEYIYQPALFKLLEDHNLKIAGAVQPVVWELFGSILTGCIGSSGYGSDLDGVEVKSAKKGGSFEYQYHLNTGLKKLEEDQHVSHLFCVYTPDYREVLVYHIEGSSLAEKFQQWIPEYKKNYALDGSSSRRQRFRKSIAYGLVQDMGEIVMTIENSTLQSSKL